MSLKYYEDSSNIVAVYGNLAFWIHDHRNYKGKRIAVLTASVKDFSTNDYIEVSRGDFEHFLDELDFDKELETKRMRSIYYDLVKTLL